MKTRGFNIVTHAIGQGHCFDNHGFILSMLHENNSAICLSIYQCKNFFPSNRFLLLLHKCFVDFACNNVICCVIQVVNDLCKPILYDSKLISNPDQSTVNVVRRHNDGRFLFCLQLKKIVT